MRLHCSQVGIWCQSTGSGFRHHHLAVQVSPLLHEFYLQILLYLLLLLLLSLLVANYAQSKNFVNCYNDIKLTTSGITVVPFVPLHSYRMYKLLYDRSSSTTLLHRNTASLCEHFAHRDTYWLISSGDAPVRNLHYSQTKLLLHALLWFCLV